MKSKLTRILILLLACLILLSSAACANRQTDTTPYEPADTETTQQTPPPAATPDPEPELDAEPEYELPPVEFISTGILASSLREQFAENETVEHQESLWNVPRNHTFYIDLEFDIREDTEFEGLTDVFAVYADAELTQSVGMTFEISTHETDPTVPEGHNRLYIRPFRTPPGLVWGSFRDLYTGREVTLDESGDHHLHEALHGETWGFLRHYYLALHVNTQTAETLERPLVTIFTLENSLDAPQSEFFVTEDGYGGFRWKPVEGADYYLILRINVDSYGNRSLTAPMMPVAQVYGTTWVHPEGRFDSSMNSTFWGRGRSEDDLLNTDDEFMGRTFNNFTVIAVNSETHSAVGTVHRGKDLASRLPTNLAWQTIRQDADETGGNTRFIPDIGLLPVQRAITMASGVTVYRRMIYDFDAAELREDRYASFDEDDDGEMSNIQFFYKTNLHFPYVIEGTIFTGVMTVEDVDPDTYREQLETARERIESFAPRGGGTTAIGLAEQRLSEIDDTSTTTDVPQEILDNSGDRIFANSALSAFLAHNMMAANESIDLSEFPESADFELLFESFFEAIYQNPLILHVAGAGTIPGTNVLIVEYKEPTNTIRRQQHAVRQIIPRIIAEIITDDMTDLEKSLAINQFLVDTTEYDWGALENAEQNNFQSVDAIFNDSFTAYGILINRVGVCAGYAAAFRLLADAAGLESIVVTGHLDGFLPHAWNRVNIDGQWYTIDVTNNANEFLFNVFLHLPDDVAGSVLIEDSSFMLNSVLGYHRADSTANEYFHITNRFFDRNDIASELAELVRQTGRATLRTDFDLDDATFFDIATEVMVLLDTTDLHGFHWLGVIFMTDGS